MIPHSQRHLSPVGCATFVLLSSGFLLQRCLFATSIGPELLRNICRTCYACCAPCSLDPRSRTTISRRVTSYRILHRRLGKDPTPDALERLHQIARDCVCKSTAYVCMDCRHLASRYVPVENSVCWGKVRGHELHVREASLFISSTSFHLFSDSFILSQQSKETVENLHCFVFKLKLLHNSIQ